MSKTSQQRSADFLQISGQFRLGDLTTEASHPVTANLSETAKLDTAAALRLLLEVDDDVLRKYREFADSGRAGAIRDHVLGALRKGGRLFFTGCGSTGRLSIQLVSIWRDFWQQQRRRGLACTPSPEQMEQRALAVMAGGDYALIKAVEGFEDYSSFGAKQIEELGLGPQDVVFAITEGGETSFVIGTAWKGVEVGAKVYFIYNNPDETLCQHVERSRQVIQDARIEKVNLTTGPMAITGSTRMQATSIQLCVMLTVLEMVLRDWMSASEPQGPAALDSGEVPALFARHLEVMLGTLQSSELLSQLAAVTSLEESVYRSGHKSNYFADRLAIDVLTDTTERSPTYCTPPFRKFDDRAASESWAFLFVSQTETARAWEHIIKRRPRCVEWTESDVRPLLSPEKLARTCEILRNINHRELFRFRVGLDGMAYRTTGQGDCGIGILLESEKDSLLAMDGFHRRQLEAGASRGLKTGLICFGGGDSLAEVGDFLRRWNCQCAAALVRVPKTNFLLEGVTRVGVKMLLNAHSTCLMVGLGRVMGNFMIWVVPSNLKLIDRATRYIEKLTGLDYPAANSLLFEIIEYVEPRMRADQAYPPVVGMAVLRHRQALDNLAAEQRLIGELS